MSEHDLACPNCHQVDRVQKVTAVVEAGTSEIHLSGASLGGAHTLGHGATTIGGALTSLSGSQVSALGMKLMSPPRPTFVDPWGCGPRLLVMVGGIALPFLLVALLDPSAIGAVGFLILASCVGAAAYTAWAKLQVASSRRARLPLEIRRWERAMARWQALYYCHRCDGVFLPGEAGLAPANNMMGLLYQKVSAGAAA